MEHDNQARCGIVDGKTLQNPGMLIASVEATAPGSQGTLVVEVRTARGGSIVSARASVSWSHELRHNTITLPFEAGNDLKTKWEDIPDGAPSPTCTIRIHNFA